MLFAPIARCSPRRGTIYLMNSVLAPVVIVGGGAAGLMAAISAARRGVRGVVVLDGARTLGAKILVAGGGRCNVTNARVTPDDYCGGPRHVLRHVLAAWTSRQTVEFFAELGVPLHEEEDGKLFPDSNQARTVLEALLGEATRLGVQLATEHRVDAIERVSRSFAVHLHGATARSPVEAQHIVLATGGLSLPKTGSDGAGYRFAQDLGHTIVPTTPALDPLLLAGDFHAGLSGVALPAELTIRVAGEKLTRLTGALLWTHFGASGPVALNAARFWQRATLQQRNVAITASFLPGVDFSVAEQRLLALAASNPRLHLHNALAQLAPGDGAVRDETGLPARFAQALLAALEIPAVIALAQLDRARRRQVLHALTAWELPVIGTRGYKYAEVTAGGVPLEEIDAATMGSRCCPGLFLAGEVLDVDGRIGGFNFQWAWATGYVAGVGLASAPGRTDDTRAEQ
jgi:predicted Rossmann fold flavoprotein